jgi:hypothetical protein
MVLLNPFHRGHFVSGLAFQNGRVIADALNRYVGQHGNFPDGNSSTEVFQKLLDSHLIDDPAVFYIPYLGKVKATAGERLKPENVSWDFTRCQPRNDLGSLPLVFTTGCRINYAPGGLSTALRLPLPAFSNEHLTWYQSWNHDVLLDDEGYLAVIHWGGGEEGCRPKSDGSIPDLHSSDFNADGVHYVQLTPDGPLR